MSVFLTGVTGYLGGAIAEALQRSGYMVLGLVRSEKSAKVLRPANIYGRAGPRNVHISSHAREQIYRKGRDICSAKRMLRPCHAKADPQVQDVFKKN